MEKYREKAVVLLKVTKAERLYMNPRGEFFTKEDLAKNSLKKGEKLEVCEASETRELRFEAMNIDELNVYVDNLTEISRLEEILAYEQGHQKRKTAIELLENKINELENAE